jgi:hypothetical protein
MPLDTWSIYMVLKDGPSSLFITMEDEPIATTERSEEVAEVLRKACEEAFGKRCIIRHADHRGGSVIGPYRRPSYTR